MIDVANEVLRETYKGKKSVFNIVGGRSNESIRSAMVTAKRFVLDEDFSEFLAYLASVPFRVAKERQADILESLRHSARLPFNKMWMQVHGQGFRRGLLTASPQPRDPFGNKLLPEQSDDVIKDYGYLLEQDTQYHDLVWVSEYLMLQDTSEVATLPFKWCYMISDSSFPSHLGIDTKAGVFAHGLVGMPSQQVGIKYEKDLSAFRKNDTMRAQYEDDMVFLTHKLVPEFGGILRYIITFLATLNSVPKVENEVKVQKGFVGGGLIRKYMDHTVLRLNLPAKQTKMVMAKRLIAMARRGWHEVRPHWRIMHQVLGGHYCRSREAHLWAATDSTGHARCTECDAKRVWITLPHGRGDPAIQIRTHHYHVTHSDN